MKRSLKKQTAPIHSLCAEIFLAGKKCTMDTRKCGPSGGTGGAEFVDDVLPEDFQVAEVRVHAQERVHAVHIVHETCDGGSHSFPLHGSAAGKLHVVRLDADEFIVAISGRFSECIDSLRIYTNKQVSPVFGGDRGGSAYIYEAPPGAEIVGFFGRAGDALDAIGVVLRRRGL
jgi:hypothetical protein